GMVAGHPEQSVTVFYGYGRRETGRVGTSADAAAREFDVYTLRTSDALSFGSGLEIAKAGRYLIARTQEHHLMENRDPDPAAALAENHKDPTATEKKGQRPRRTHTATPACD